jgi:Tol biopolymer transport system component
MEVSDMRRAATALVVTVVLLAGVVTAQQKRQQDIDLQAAIRTETVDGDLNGAIKQYGAIVSKYKADRTVAATALIHMAECYQKLGDVQARKIYEQVVREYADQKEVVVIAQARLSGAATTERHKGITLRKVWDGHASGLSAAVLTTVSRDGRRLAYVPDRTGTVNLHDLTNGTDRPLTIADGCGGPAAISRDGTQVSYEHYCGAYGSALRLVNVPGSGVPASRLLYENADVAQITPMDMSPDKASIAVVVVRKDRTKQIGLVATEDGSLRVLKSVDWRGPTRIFFSPDGRDLAYDLPASDASAQRDVFVLAVDGSREIPVVVHPRNDVVMGWSPDGRHILFASDRRSAMGLWAQAFADGKLQGTPELIAESINSTWSLGVTSSGGLYLGLSAGDEDISVVPVDLTTGKQAGPPVRPIQSFIGTNLEPAWSPDGKSLAYVSWRSNNPIFGDPRILAIRSVDTGETRELRPNLVYFDQMSWAPDGHALFTAGSDLKGRNWIFRIDARTGEGAPIVPLPQGFERAVPQWSPDGTRMYYRVPLKEGDIDGDVAFIERILASGREREVARGDLGSINLSPDGRWIAAQRGDPSTQSEVVVIIGIEGGETTPILSASRAQRIVRFSGIPWTPDGRSVLVRKVSSGNMRESSSELWLVPIADAPPRKLDIDVNRWAAGNRGVISLSPDGRQIAFRSGQDNAEVWVLENFLPALKASR